MPLDGAFRKSVTVTGEQRAYDRRTHGGRAFNVLAQRRNYGRNSVLRSREDCAAAGLDLQLRLFGPRAHLGPVPGIHHSGVDGVLEKDGIQLLACAVVEQTAVVPALEAQAIGIDAERPSARRRE